MIRVANRGCELFRWCAADLDTLGEGPGSMGRGADRGLVPRVRRRQRVQHGG